MSVNSVTFVAPNLAWGEARGGSIPRQWGCDRRATKPQAKFGATLRAAVPFGPGGVARSLQIHCRDMLVARALPGPKTPRRKRHRIYAHDHLVVIEAGDVLEARLASLVIADGLHRLRVRHQFERFEDGLHAVARDQKTHNPPIAADSDRTALLRAPDH